MKLLCCTDCKHFHSINNVSTGMCHCGHCYFCVHSWKKKISEKSGKQIIVDSKVVWVYGPCQVWYLSQDAIDSSKPGSIQQIQLMREPHPNIIRMDKGTILFKDQPDLLRKYKGAQYD